VEAVTATRLPCGCLFDMAGGTFMFQPCSLDCPTVTEVAGVADAQHIPFDVAVGAIDDTGAGVASTAPAAIAAVPPRTREEILRGLDVELDALAEPWDSPWVLAVVTRAMAGPDALCEAYTMLDGSTLDLDAAAALDRLAIDARARPPLPDDVAGYLLRFYGRQPATPGGAPTAARPVAVPVADVRHLAFADHSGAWTVLLRVGGGPTRPALAAGSDATYAPWPETAALSRFAKAMGHVG
jgi:hypothetical protein